MEGLSAAVKSVCLISAAVCITDMITGGTKLRRQIRFILDLIFIIVIAAPVVKGTFELELPDISQYELSDSGDDAYRTAMTEATAANISSVLMSQLEAAGISCSKIETNVNISEDNSISISSVTISADNFEAAAEIIRNSLGYDTEVLDGNF